MHNYQWFAVLLVCMVCIMHANFVTDFCDYFLMHEFPADKVPEKCICLWYLTDEYKKEGINWTKVGDERCEPYKKYASNIRKPFRKKICENGACGNELPGEAHDVLQGVGMHVPISPSDIMHGQPDVDAPGKYCYLFQIR